MNQGISAGLALIGFLFATEAKAAFTQIPGCASWITSDGNGTLYGLGCESSVEKSIWVYDRLQPPSFPWRQLPGSAVQISVHDTTLWILRSNGAMQRWNGTSWNLPISGCASYIAAATNNAIWMLGCDASANKSIWMWDGSWHGLPGAAVKITVTTDDYAFVVNSYSNTYKWNGSTWVLQPGTTNQLSHGGYLTALGIGDNNAYAWSPSGWGWIAGATPGSPTKQLTGTVAHKSYYLSQNGNIFEWY